ncbi:hypothetical protein COOONC_16466, partial [Cooperia oncophora]
MPVTRSQAKSASASADGASAQPSDTKVEPSDPVREPSLSIFADLADDSLLHGRDAKAICDATTTAIEQVWNDTCATTASLTRKINESNAALQDKLKESFAAVGKRLDNLPTIAMLHGFGHFAGACPSPRRQGSLPSQPVARSPFPNRSQPAPARSYNAQAFTVDPLSDVATLSASLRDSQDQLQRSQARVSALLRRNEELTQASLERPVSPPHPTSSVLPDIRALFCVVLCLTVFASPGNAFDAWLCPSDNPATFFFLPDTQNCSEMLPNVSSPLDKVVLHVYRPNTQLYSSPAFFCKIIRHSVTFSVNFFGARRETHTETPLPVSAEECRQMALHHRCSQGEMLEFSGPLGEPRTRQPPFGCCVDHVATVTNCYFYNTSVQVRHSDAAPQSPAGDMSSCPYADGTCTLSDGSILVWTPNREEECSFILLARMSGHLMGTIWMSDDNEFALSWNERSPRVADCSKQLTVTDQGYAIRVSHRQPRSSPPNVGLVTTNQLSAQLLAVEGATYASVSTLFRNALRALCDRTNTMTVFLHSALASHPTSTMRALLSRRDISARHLGGGYVQLRRCIALPSASWRLLTFNGTCYDRPWVEVRLPSGSAMRAFLDPDTGVLHRQASMIPCEESGPFTFPSSTGLRRFSPLDGTWSSIPSHEVTP